MFHTKRLYGSAISVFQYKIFVVTVSMFNRRLYVSLYLWSAAVHCLSCCIYPTIGERGGGGWEEGAGGTSYCVYVSPLETSRFGGMESGPMLTPREKSPLRKIFILRGGSNPRRCIKKDSEPNTLTANELFQPREVSDESCCLALYQHTDTGPASPRADPPTPGTRQGRQYGTNF